MKHFDTERFLLNKYNHLLIGLILLFILSPSLQVRDPSVKFPLLPLLLLIVLLAVLRTNFPKGKFFRFALVAVILDFLLNLTVYFLPLEYAGIIHACKFANRVLVCAFFAVTIFTLSRRLFRIRRVTSDTIKGGICTYMLLGFFWAILYTITEDLLPGSFVSSAHEEILYAHFSFTTLTTLGYGDITPTGRVATLLSNSEAMIGQLYLAIFVARLVGLYIAGEIRHDEKKLPGEKT